MRISPPIDETFYGFGNVIEDTEEKNSEASLGFPSSHHLSSMAGAQDSSAAALEALITKQKKASYVKVTEEPASKGLRFRYECEGRSAGSIPGVSSTNDKKTYPTIEVVGYKGRAVVVVSCVTSEVPYRAHPHNLVGKEGCKKGVCTLEINPETMSCSFPSLGIQCVKKKEIEESLSLRQQIRVDPFQTGFSHRDNPQSIDLNSVRLCFQVFLEGNEKGSFTFALKPVVSEPIYDKKARSDLTICRMTEYSAPVTGGKEMLIFCDKVTKDDIQIRFYEEKNGKILWEGLGDFQPSDVHKQYGICFRTPRYENLEIDRPVKVSMQLKRPSDGTVSESRAFEFLPLDSGRGFWAAKRLKTNYNVFNSILSVDQEMRSQAGNNGNGALVNSFKAESQEEEPASLKRKAHLITENNPVIPEEAPERPEITVYRPSSDISMISNINTDAQNVNEILCLTSGGQEKEMSLVLDNISVNTTTLLTELPSEEKDPRSHEEEGCSSDDVKYVLSSSTPPGNMDIDIGLLYDDVMQCVYDDVDDTVDDYKRVPPVPPARKKVTSHASGAPPIPSPEEEECPKHKPLPDTPSKFKSMLTSKFPGSKKQSPKKTKDPKGKASAEPAVSPTSNSNNPADSRQSLFQRLFARTKSHDPNNVDSSNTGPLLDEEGNEILCTLPVGDSMVNNTSANVDDENSNLVSDLDLKDFIDSGNLSQLDNIVTEFANQYLPDNEAPLDNAAEQERNGNSSQFFTNSGPSIDNSSFQSENPISRELKN